MGKHVPSLAAQNLDLRAHALAIIIKSLILKKEDNFLDIEIQETVIWSRLYSAPSVEACDRVTNFNSKLKSWSCGIYMLIAILNC